VAGWESIRRSDKVPFSGLNFVCLLPLVLPASLLTILLALGVGTCALSILPGEKKSPPDHLDPRQNVPSSPPPPTPDLEAQFEGQLGTVLEQMTSCDGLVQLMPRKRKAGDAVEHRGDCKGPGPFTQNVAGPLMVEEDDEDEFPQPGTSSGPPTREREHQPKRPEQIQEMKSPKLVTIPMHVGLPPPSEPKAPPSPLRSPGHSANHPPQIDITPGLPVLVVDDDKMTRMLFQRMLGRLKCSVTTAVNGYEALQLITGDQNVSQTPAEEEHEHSLFSSGDDHESIMEMKEREREKEEKESKFAIVFLDNQMPVMSGVEMVRKLRKLGRKDLVVGVTGEFPLSSRFNAQWVDIGGGLTTRTSQGTHFYLTRKNTWRPVSTAS